MRNANSVTIAQVVPTPTSGMCPDMTRGSERYRPLANGLSLLRLFDNNNLQLTGPEIVERMPVHKTTTYRLLGLLVEEGFISRDEVTGKYAVGLAAFLVGELYGSSDSLQVAAAPVVRLLSDLTGEATNLGVLSGNVVVFVLLEESTHEIQWNRHLGMTLPAHCCALGKAILSALPETEIERLFPEEQLPPRTKNSLATKTALIQELTQIRSSGVASDFEECVVSGCGFASPIVNHKGEISGAMSIAVPTFRFGENRQPLFAEAVRLAAGLVSYRLGNRRVAHSIRSRERLRAWWLGVQPSERTTVYPLP